MDKLPIEKGTEAVRKALGLNPYGETIINKSFHQNPDGTLMETTATGRLSDDQIETIKSEQEDLA